MVNNVVFDMKMKIKNSVSYRKYNGSAKVTGGPLGLQMRVRYIKNPALEAFHLKKIIPHISH